MSDWWQRKIVALLHDPPDKALEIRDHEDRAKALIQLALQGLPEVPPTGVPAADWTEKAKKADQIAAAADRLDFPKGVQVDWTQSGNCVVIHPLSAQKLEVVLPSDGARSAEAQANAVQSLAQRTNEPKQRFLLFWSRLEEALREQLDLPWELLPADTRIPDHSLLHHARVASAVAACLPNPATLLFTIGPVQGFIATARKTRDLWVGSYLLSYLTWCAIQVVAQELGPDHVLYPSLLGQPLVNLWLSQQNVLSPTRSPDNLTLATFPNRFMAVVPADKAEELANKAAEAVRNQWQQIANSVWQEMCSKVTQFSEAQFIWLCQIRQFPDIYWAVYPWEDKVAERYKELLGSTRFQELLAKGHGKFPPNIGTLYAALYELTERALGARKALRDFASVEEPAGKCTLCGERQALSDLTNSISADWLRREKAFWQRIASAFPGDVSPEGRERLCAICTIKRFFPRFPPQDFPRISFGFPSTDSVAAASFTFSLLEKWQQVRKTVHEFLEKLTSTGLKSVAFVGMDIPKLQSKAMQLNDEVAEKLLELDGEWLFDESYEPTRVKHAHGVDLSLEQAEGLRKLLRDLRKAIGDSPSDYYAVLLMDGDEMGKWLSGTHPQLPRYADLLHPLAREQMQEIAQSDSGWRELLASPHLVSPSLHAAISHALSNFALYCVPFVIQERYAGRLVYAGGDDVLALLPLPDALPAARELRALFSGEAKREANGEISVQFGGKDWDGWLNWNGKRLLTMGNRATASIGIVFAHRLHQLRDVLVQARQAEEDAKELYGRNALCVRWLKRSGEQVQMGAKFSYPDHHINDTVQLLHEVGEKLARRQIARGFPMHLMAEAWVLAELSEEVQRAELRRLLKRHSQKGHSQGLSDEEIEQLATQLTKLAQALDTHAKSEKVDPYDLTRPQRGLVELAKWLTLLRFLKGGGE